MQQDNYQVWHFCDNKADANELAQLVLSGQKRATAGALASYEYEKVAQPKPGDYDIITDWDGIAVCIIKTTAVKILPFNEVGADFAAREGEGDGSLEYWFQAHKRYFKREFKEYGLAFDEKIPIVCQEFELVYSKPGDSA